jgi:hypothetical protein
LERPYENPNLPPDNAQESGRKEPSLPLNHNWGRLAFITIGDQIETNYMRAARKVFLDEAVMNRGYSKPEEARNLGVTNICITWPLSLGGKEVQ